MPELNNNIIARIAIAGRALGLSYASASQLYDRGELDVSGVRIRSKYTTCNWCQRPYVPSRSNMHYCCKDCCEAARRERDRKAKGAKRAVGAPVRV